MKNIIAASKCQQSLDGLRHFQRAGSEVGNLKPLEQHCQRRRIICENSSKLIWPSWLMSTSSSILRARSSDPNACSSSYISQASCTALVRSTEALPDSQAKSFVHRETLGRVSASDSEVSSTFRPGWCCPSCDGGISVRQCGCDAYFVPNSLSSAICSTTVARAFGKKSQNIALPPQKNALVYIASCNVVRISSLCKPQVEPIRRTRHGTLRHCRRLVVGKSRVPCELNIRFSSPSMVVASLLFACSTSRILS